jgi:hypothetical protein
MSEKTTNIILMSEDLSPEDVQKLLQAIRDCEQREFPAKFLGVFLFVPTLTTHQCKGILEKISPPFAENASWGYGGG